MIYEITILGKVDMNKGHEELAGEYRPSEMTCEGEGVIADMMKAFKLDVLKYEYDGVKKMAYSIENQVYAGYMYYEVEVHNTAVPKAIEFMLEGMGGVLRCLIIRQITKEELENRK